MATYKLSGDIRQATERARTLRGDAEHLAAEAHAMTERLHGLENAARRWQREAQSLIHSARGRLDQLTAN